MNREEVIKSLERRIKDEWLKHGGRLSEWPSIAAEKIYETHLKDKSIQSLQQRVNELELQLSGKTFFDEKEVLVNRVKDLEEVIGSLTSEKSTSFHDGGSGFFHCIHCGESLNGQHIDDADHTEECNYILACDVLNPTP